MTASKSLPPRPSLESLRKQARRLARDSGLTRRHAQLAIAREYGFAGWPDLIAEVSKRLGRDLGWAAAQARRAIHDNDVERLKQLVSEYPELLSWQGDDGGGLLGMATGAYGDAFDPEREQLFTRAACAELLIDAGAIVTPVVCEGLIASRAHGLLRLFQRKGLLPRTLRFFAALGDLDAVRAVFDRNGFDENANRPTTVDQVNEAFMCACRFEHEALASFLLDRAIALDPEFGTRVDATAGRVAFVKFLIEERSLTFVRAKPAGPWQAFVMEQVMRAIHGDDVAAFVRGLRHEPWLLGEACVAFQVGLVERATLRDRAAFIIALLDLDPALAHREPPPRSQAFEFAFVYAKPHLLPLLTRIWPMPDDLPHAAGMGDLSRVARWFDESGAPALGDVESHFPHNGAHVELNDPWDAPPVQKVLDTALAWAVINRHFDVADFLLAHGADIDTRWSSHEPASILHELVFQANYEAMQFLVDRGIDMRVKDYRWNSTAQGWARYAANDEKMAQWLEDAERHRQRQRQDDPRHAT